MNSRCRVEFKMSYLNSRCLSWIQGALVEFKNSNLDSLFEKIWLRTMNFEIYRRYVFNVTNILLTKKCLFFLFLISIMIFLFFSINYIFSMYEKKIYNVALCTLHAIEDAILKNCICLNFYLQKQWVDERKLLSR